MLLQKIVFSENHVDDQYLKTYFTLLDKYFTDPWIISQSIEIAFKRKFYHLSLHLFTKLFRTTIKFEKSIWFKSENLEPQLVMVGDYYTVKSAWDLIGGEIIPRYASEVLAFVQKTIKDIHYQYAEVGHASDKTEPWSMSMLIVEDREKEHNKQPFHVLVQAFLQAIQAISSKDDVCFYLKNNLYSESILLCKIALRAIRECDCFSNDEKLSLICNESLMWHAETKEQVFLLSKRVFSKASPETQNRYLDIIEKGPNQYKDERSKHYAIYNWCVWLQGTNPTNKRIESIIKLILGKYDFVPREHPELFIQESEAALIPDTSPITSAEMVEMPIEELTSFLLEYKPNVFEGPTRWGLLSTFKDSVKENPEWANKLTNFFYKKRVDTQDIWDRLFWGLGEAELSVEDALSWCTELITVIDIIPDVKEVARFLLNVLRNEAMQQKYKEYEQQLLELSIKLWTRRDTSSPPEMRLIDKAFNTTTGIVLMSWIYMVSYSGEKELPELYKSRFEDALQINSWEYEVAACILAGHFNFMCYRDREWCNDHFEPLLTGDNQEAFVSAWEGVSYFSRRISKDTADIMAPIYLKAVKNINWLEGEAREGFIDLFLTLLIFVVDKPTLKYIPECYRSSSEVIRNQFVKSIGYRLENLDFENKTNWWNRWLKRYLENRKSNKPVELSKSECSTLFMLLPHLDFVFEDAVKILCKGSISTNLDYLFWHELEEKKLASTYPHSVAKLLITLLKSIKDLGFEKDYITRIVTSLHDLNEKENHQLQEVLLKHSVNVLLD